MYTNSKKKKKKKNPNNNTLTKKEPNHSTKSSKDIEFVPMYCFTQVNKILRKTIFKKWVECSSLSNTRRFLSFETIQKIYKGASLQTFLCFFSHKRTMPKRASLKVAACIQWIPKRLNKNCQRILASEQ